MTTLYSTSCSASLRCLLAAATLAACTSQPSAAQGNRNQPGAAPAAAPAPSGSGSQSSAALPALSGEHHPVFSLHDNRLLAHLVRDGGLLVSPGRGGGSKYYKFRRPWLTWSTLPRTVEGEPAVLAIRSVSWLVVPLTAAQAEEADTLSLRVYSPRTAGFRVKVGGRRLEPVRLAQGWQTVHLELNKGALRAGENELELSWTTMTRIAGKKAAGALAWLRLGKGKAEQPGPLYAAEGGKLVLPRGGGLAYYVHPYAGTKLRLGIAAGAGGCALRVRALGEGKAALDKVLDPAGQAADTAVDLAPIADRVSRLELLAEGQGCKTLSLSRAELVRPGPAPRVKRGKAPKNVLFWLVDNARADRYTLYNPKTRVKTPVITALGKGGAVFERAYIQGTESRVSHASIWTGLYPKQARFVDPKAKLKEGWVTLAEAVRERGKRATAAWVANGFVSSFWGFAQGFDRFRNTLHKGGGLTGERLAGHAIEYIKKVDKPFYLYVGTIDPHVSWRGRQPWLDQYSPEPYQGRFKKNVMGPTWDKIAGGGLRLSATDKKRILAIYDSTVSYNDHHLGRVLQALEEKGIRDETMVVITADHGEEFWEYGRAGHGASCRQNLVAVPLVIHYPPLFGKGVRVSEGVDVLSLLPTIVDALGLPIPERVQGESLLPLAQGVGRGYPRPSLATQYELAHTIRLERWKLRVGGKGIPRLYDMTTKKPEAKNLAGDHPVATRWLTDALSTFLVHQRRWRSTRWGVASNHKAQFPQDLEKGTAPKIIRP